MPNVITPSPRGGQGEGATGGGLGGLTPGQQIIHDRFGLGTVERVEGTGIDARATVLFQTAGRKQLLLRFARFKIV